MSDTTRRPNGEADEHEPPGGDAIRRLLRLAGPRPAVPAERAARVHAVVHERWRSTTRALGRRRVLLRGGLTLAAATALIATLSFVWWWAGGPRPTGGRRVAHVLRMEGTVHRGSDGRPAVGDALSAGVELATGADGRVAIEVGPGISVRLDRASRLRVASDRVLELFDGAVYVDSGVRPGGVQPLEVHTPMGIVRDIGTEFELRLSGGGDGQELRLSVREGRAGLDRNGRTYEAQAGTRVTVEASGMVHTGVIDAHGPEWDWALQVAPPFRIEGRPLSEYLGWVSRETGREVRFTDPSIEGTVAPIVLHGSVEGLTPEDTLAAVLPTCGLRHRVEGSTLWIERLSRTGPGRRE